MSYSISPQAAKDGLQGRVAIVGTDKASAALGGNYLPVDLRALTAEAFGYSALRRYDASTTPTQGSNAGAYNNIPGYKAVLDPGLPGVFNQLGLPVFKQVILGSVLSPTRGPVEGVILNDPLVTVALPFNIVQTVVQGRRGTVKEYIGEGDYEVVIRTIVATDPHAPTTAARFNYPVAQVRAIHELARAACSIPVSGWLHDVFGIASLMIKDVRYESLPGFVNLQAVELDCLSDLPIELELAGSRASKALGFNPGDIDSVDLSSLKS